MRLSWKSGVAYLCWCSQPRMSMVLPSQSAEERSVFGEMIWERTIWGLSVSNPPVRIDVGRRGG